MKPPKKPRVDELMVERQVVDDLPEARALIMRGHVLVTDAKGRERKVATAGERLDRQVSFRLKNSARPYVSRAGIKLAAALDQFRLDVRDRVAADIGLSTGGFTDCLLQRGVARVHGVDVAYGTVAWKIRQDPRVVLHERTNARHLTVDTLGELVDLVVADVSFVSTAALIPGLAQLLRPGGQSVVLVKPQFEAPRGSTQGGIVRDPAVRQQAVTKVAEAAESVDMTVVDRIESPISGADGNIEWLLYLSKKDASPPKK